jgi:nicotinamide phosphoribosyltransferase
MNIFPLHAADFYKVGHLAQYQEGTELVYSNFTARGDRLANMLPSFDHKVVFFGLRGTIREILIDLWDEQFFKRPKDEVVGRFMRRMDTALGPGAVSPAHIEALHDLGYLPLHIKALPEGSRVNLRVPLFTVVNTHPDFYWLTNYIETMISAESWKQITNATVAFEYRRLLDEYAARTGSPKEFVQWQGHDFSMRGLSGLHDAVKSGAAHLLSFTGTDTIAAIDYLEEHYGADASEELIGGSVPATEHSVMCMGGKLDEIETIRRLVQDLYPSGVVSIVADTWNLWDVLTLFAPALKDIIEARQPNALGLAKVVFRPDSGDPVEILCGTAKVIDIDAKDISEARLWAIDVLQDRASEETAHGERGPDEMTGHFRFGDEIFMAKVRIEWNRHDKMYYYQDGASIVSFERVELTPAEKGAVECLWDVFGGTITATGHRLLNPRVGLIYGDSITLDRAARILDRLDQKSFASGNVVFGIGSYTYQHVTRDTFGHAYKSTFGVVDGEGRELFKDPITDGGLKKSAKGLLRVEKVGDDFVLHDQQTWAEEAAGELRTVFYNGAITMTDTLATIRARLLGGS